MQPSYIHISFTQFRDHLYRLQGKQAALFVPGALAAVLPSQSQNPELQTVKCHPSGVYQGLFRAFFPPKTFVACSLHIKRGWRFPRKWKLFKISRVGTCVRKQQGKRKICFMQRPISGSPCQLLISSRFQVCVPAWSQDRMGSSQQHLLHLQALASFNRRARNTTRDSNTTSLFITYEHPSLQV